MNTVNLSDVKKNKRKEDLLTVVADLQKQIEDGALTELVTARLTASGDVSIDVCCADTICAIGLFETGKHILITQL